MTSKLTRLRLLASAVVLACSGYASAASYAFKDLATLASTYSYAQAINNAGQVVGYANVTGYPAYHATLWNGSTATDLNTFLDASSASAGWVLREATGINDNSWSSAMPITPSRV